MTLYDFQENSPKINIIQFFGFQFICMISLNSYMIFVWLLRNQTNHIWANMTTKIIYDLVSLIRILYDLVWLPRIIYDLVWNKKNGKIGYQCHIFPNSYILVIFISFSSVEILFLRSCKWAPCEEFEIRTGIELKPINKSGFYLEPFIQIGVVSLRPLSLSINMARLFLNSRYSYQEME